MRYFDAPVTAFQEKLYDATFKSVSLWPGSLSVTIVAASVVKSTFTFSPSNWTTFCCCAPSAPPDAVTVTLPEPLYGTAQPPEVEVIALELPPEAAIVTPDKPSPMS